MPIRRAGRCVCRCAGTSTPRIILLNPEFNPEGYGFEQYSHDPKIMLTVQSRFWEYQATQINQTCDSPVALPEEWTFYLDTQNIYDEAYFGETVIYAAGQCPATHNHRTVDDIDDFLAMDYSKPLENPWLKERLEFHQMMVREAEHFTYLGRKGRGNALHSHL